MKINKFYKNITVVSIMYLLIGIFYTYPLIIEFSQKIFAQVGDPFGTISKFWQFTMGIKNISFLFPEQPLYRLYTHILNYFFDGIVTFNILTIISFVFSAIPFYLIIRKITKNNYAAFFAGFVVAICPYRIAQLLQHINLANVGFLGFFLYFILLVSDNFSVKNIVFLSIFFLLTVFDCYTYGIFAMVAFMIFVLVKLAFEISNKNELVLEKREIYTVIGGLITIIVLLCVFILGPVYYSKNDNQISEIQRNKEELTTYSAYSGYYFLPGPQNPFIGQNTADYFNEKIQTLGTNYTEQTDYIGYVVLLLSMFYILYFIKHYKETRTFQRFCTYFFIVLGVASTYFSFSYPIMIRGINFSFAEKVYNLIPFLRVYSRFGLITILSCSILSAMGLEIILRNIKDKNLRILILLIVIILVSFEYVLWPKDRIQPISRNNVPEVYKNLPDNNCKLIEYPFFSKDAPQGYEYLIWTMYHNCDLINENYINFENPKLFCEEVRDINSLSDIEKLKQYGVNYIIINRDLFLDTKEFWLSTETINNTIPDLDYFDNLIKMGQWDNKELYKIE